VPRAALLREGHDADPFFDDTPTDARCVARRGPFDNARPLDEPLSREEVAAIEEAMAAPGPGLTSEELLERLRPNP
jgi:hypothetical protein